jgi:transcription-repair coupling factor (superfamily II helicase)
LKFPHPRNQEVLDLFGEHRYVTLSGGGNISSKAFVVSDLLDQNSELSKMVWLVNDAGEQDAMMRALKDWFDFEVEIMDGEGGYRAKMKCLSALMDDRKLAMVMTYQQLLDEYPSRKKIQDNTMTFEVGDEMSATDVFEQLIEMEYDVSDDQYLEQGNYLRHGDVLDVFPINSTEPYRIELDFDKISSIYTYDQSDYKKLKEVKKVTVYPLKEYEGTAMIWDYLNKKSIFVEDELDLAEDLYGQVDHVVKQRPNDVSYVLFTSFLEENEYHYHLHYLSVLKYQNKLDFLEDMREKWIAQWRVYLFTKNGDEVKALLDDRKLSYVTDPKKLEGGHRGIVVMDLDKDAAFPYAFQNPHLKFSIITDREIIGLREGAHRDPATHAVFLDFLTGLKVSDYVVHSDHGVAKFNGLDKRTIDEITREYLCLGYAENDKLFVPIDQADKVSKYIGAGDSVPRLTRLGSTEWATVTNRVKKETQKIAKELLKLYAERKRAKGHAFKDDNDVQRTFESEFPYDETPGQISAIRDTKKDMEKAKPMDRLVCGDVGFGKTEVAMRAAFKAVQSGKQVAVVAPITILVDQHYRSFHKRMDHHNVRVEMLSRFRTQADQKKILKKLAAGEVDIVIGTHRLLQPDIAFKDLGLVIVDEEQRFGVKQKEKFKELRREVDILTLTATPIPRTLNISLHGLRDITTITTPPPGRLPVITEVRRFSFGLIREAIQRELDRGGQVYFLHNRVQTIDEMTERLKKLIPKARFISAHGKMGSNELEERIIAFKDKKYDVLVSSTIIENGIDLANANTLIVNKAEKFGLAQLYQLRGRVGRGKAQAYAYFLYHSQRLPLDAKKRLRAIVEASELGAGFQIAMKDLEIRGAGDILGASQHGSLNVVGVSHFIRMLNQTVENLKEGRVDEVATGVLKEVSIEIPLPSFIPDDYIVSAKDKIGVYQRLAAADNFDYLSELRTDLIEDYGRMPKEVANLFHVLEMKLLASRAFLTNVRAENIHGKGDRLVVLSMSDKVKPENILNVLEYNAKWLVSGTKLKINFEDLGVNWVDELKESLKRLGKSMKNKPGDQVKK